MPPSNSKFRVTATGLNLRNRPSKTNSQRLAVLPQGQHVLKLEETANPDYWKVQTELGGSTLVGYVAHKFLDKISDAEFDSHKKISAVHMREGLSHITRNNPQGRAYPIGEASAPKRDGTTQEDKVKQLGKIIKWLKVESSSRYSPTSKHTFCNIYAYDYCYLAGVYIPRVWWKEKALLDLANGKKVEPQYNNTIKELNANQLYDWLDEFSADFGWERVFDYDTLQEAANKGMVGIICAKRVDVNRSGHITAVVPETSSKKAVRKDGSVSQPLQSQAGAVNNEYFTRIWWTHSRYSAFGYWIHK